MPAHTTKSHMCHMTSSHREKGREKMHSLHKLFEFFRLICIWQTLADKKSTIVQRTTCKDKWTFAEIVKWDQFISASFHVVFSTRTIWSGDFFLNKKKTFRGHYERIFFRTTTTCFAVKALRFLNCPQMSPQCHHCIAKKDGQFTC